MIINHIRFEDLAPRVCSAMWFVGFSVEVDDIQVLIMWPTKDSENDSVHLLFCLCTDDVHLHWYGKKPGIEGRKMGHITITETNIENALSKAVMIRHLLKGAYHEE